MASAATQKRDKSPAAREVDASKKDDVKKVEEVKKSSGFFTPKNIAIIAVLAVVVFGLKKYLGEKVNIKETMESSIAFIEAQGKTAVIWYCVLTFVGVVCLIPTTPMELAGGFLFSPNWGGPWGVLVFTGAAKLAANVVSVLIARHILKDWVNKNMVAKSELLTMVSKAVKEEPWKMAFLVRGSMVPLAVKNYGLGVMDIDYLPIACCSCIFTNFYAMQNIYMGSTLQNLKDVFAPKQAAAAGADMDWTQTVKKLMPIVFNVVLVIFLVKAIKGQIKKQKAAIEKDLKAKEGKKE